MAALATLSALLMVAATAAAAEGAVTVGQLPPSPPSPSCTPGFDYLQPSITGGQFYSAREAGTITSWSTYSSSPGAVYEFKVFRRTSDPDVFQAIAHAPPHTLTTGLNTVATRIHVESGDMIGLHETGPDNSCTFPILGDAVITAPVDLGDGASTTFAPRNGVRLNLSAALVPSNDFSVAGIQRDRRRGTATLGIDVSNPGVVTMHGKGLRKSAAKTPAMARVISFHVAAAGKWRRKLARRGHVWVKPLVTFSPVGGDPASQRIPVVLRQRRLAVSR